MITFLRRLRSLKRQILLLCLLTVGTIWFHHTTSLQIIGGIHQTGKVSARLGIVYEWVKYNNPIQYSATMRAHDPVAGRVTESESPTGTTEAEIRIQPNQTIDSRGQSHPLDNFCQYPVLNPEDENLRHVISHTRLHVCKKVQLELLTFDYDRGVLIFNRTLADRSFAGRKPRCQYRPFSGGIRPRIMDVSAIGEWIPVVEDTTPIDYDLIETKCFAAAPPSNSTPKPATNATAKPKEVEIFRYAFGHIVKRNETAGKKPRPYTKNDESTLSIDFLFLDSTAFNMMRRHMPKTWRYMKEVMGFYHLEGYNKVGDNSMVNLMPILAGLRYGNQATDMRTEVTDDRPIDVEPLPFLWKSFRERGCATMFNDDIADYTRGFLNYPWTHVKGFAEIPTDHFMRPWHIYHRRFPTPSSSRFCFGNYPYVNLQLNFFEQMIKKYRDTCHFSFNFITDLPHDDPNNLELADDDLHALLKRLYTGNYLNNTVLFVMGDHGNRIGYVMYTYVGRIEERMTLFSVYFPEWYRRKHPEAMRQLEINMHRLTSNYDVHRMVKEIFNDTLSQKAEDPIDPKMAVSKGVSLFRTISTNRTCSDANIPPPHCTCLEPVPPWAATSKLSPNHTLYQLSKDIVFNWTRLQLEPFSTSDPECTRVDKIEVLSLRTLTTSQMIQHGVRDLSSDQTEKLHKRIDGDIEYVDVVYRMWPIDVTARARLQYYKKPKKKVILNIPPHPFYGLLGFVDGRSESKTDKEVSACSRPVANRDRQVPWFCRCKSK